MYSVNNLSNSDQLREVPGFDRLVISLCTDDLSDSEKIYQLQAYLDMVKNIVKPGCPPELLTFALSSMSSLVKMLSSISSDPRFRASL